LSPQNHRTMPKKKKSFINKKTASTYHLVRRSQRDIGLEEDNEATNETLSQFVLMPSPTNKQHRLDPIELEAFDARRPRNTNDLGFGRNIPEETTNDDDDENEPPSMMKTLGDQLSDRGLTESNYDYSKHLMPIDGSGTFLNASNGQRYDPMRDPRSKVVPLTEEEEGQEKETNQNPTSEKGTLAGLGSLIGGGIEVERNLESIALTPDCMDDDMAQALFGDVEEGGFEEILDDFVLTAAKDDLVNVDDEKAAFDYDEHIRQLIQKAQSKESVQGVVKVADDFFANVKPLSQKHPGDSGDESDDNHDEQVPENQDDIDSLDQEFSELGLHSSTPGVAPAHSPEEEKALCDKFEQTLLEYDSDEVGDLDNECEQIMGDRPLEGDAQLEAALDDFLEEKRDHVFMEGTRHIPEKQRKGGSSYSALVGTTMVPAKDLQNEEYFQQLKEENSIPVEVAIKQTLKEADQILANPEMEPPEEDVLIDGKSYFSQSAVNPWDCESILSTYSNLDNNPTTIGRSRRSRKGKKKQKDIEPVMEEEYDDYEDYHEIKLSNKTGLPMGVLPVTEKEEKDPYGDIVNKGKARKKKETKEEKKLRKAAVKEERMISRIQKKMVKEAFKDEFMKRSMDAVVDDVGGKSVFRYS